MAESTGDDALLAGRLRSAFFTHDLEAFGALLSDDVRWGADDHPRRCRNRAEVLATFGGLLSIGVDAEITELSTGRNGVLCALHVHWPEGVNRPSDRRLFHVYLVTAGLITEIRRYDDRPSAAEAAGLPA